MTKDEAIYKAIDAIKGRDLEPGAIVATKEEPICRTLLRYEGEHAIIETPEGEKKWDRSEIFDVNKITNIANHFLNLGFWEDGMESTILHLS